MEVGKGYVIGNLFGVAAETAAEPVTGFETSSLHVTGVFRIFPIPILVRHPLENKALLSDRPRRY